MESKYHSDRWNFKAEVFHSKKYTKEVKGDQNPLIELEERANEKFLTLVNNTKLDEGFHFHALKYFDQAKSLNLYNLLAKMPKGGLLHHHFYIHANWEYLATIALDEELAFANLAEETIILLNEGEQVPEHFIKIKGSNLTQKDLQKCFQFGEEDKHSKDYWMRFVKKIYNQFAILLNTKYLKNYIVKVFEDCIDEGIMIYSGRQLFGLVNEYGTKIKISIEQETDIIIEAYEEVKKKNPLFEANLIYVEYRHNSLADTQKHLNECVNLKLKKKAYDDMVIGFDLVGDEILNESKQFAHLLYDYKQSLREEHPDLNFEYYLHSGESISLSNDNLVDCILLKTPRIGHGTNLIHHLYLIDEFKKNEICIECNPLSNQILNYVPDLRLHPIKVYLDFGLKVTINSDDDGVFGTSSLLTFDFFICAFSLNFDLYDFKQVILNSINHSGVKEERKEAIKKDFFENWRKFLDFMIDNL